MPNDTATLDERIAAARARGEKAGKAAASWVFDGNTTDETYRTTLQGIEDGDPEVMDRLSYSPLSGEWAGESITELFGDLMSHSWDDRTNEMLDELEALEDAYETAATAAYWDGIEATCRLQVEV